MIYAGRGDGSMRADAPNSSADLAAAPAPLVEELRRRSLVVMIHPSPLLALAEMVILERRLNRGEAPGVFMLLFLEPDSDPRAGALLERIRLYAPHAGVWRYCARERPSLRAWNPATLPTPSASALFHDSGRAGVVGRGVKSDAPAHGAAPTLRLAGHDDDLRLPAPPPPRVTSTASPSPGPSPEFAPPPQILHSPASPPFST
ncbi:MAG: hypothetical protein CVV40_00640, partial [Planctomycetes bacterium HGW-Planctomycetes-2]